jgi:hypothetical protein
MIHRPTLPELYQAADGFENALLTLGQMFGDDAACDFDKTANFLADGLANVRWEISDRTFPFPLGTVERDIFRASRR